MTAFPFFIVNTFSDRVFSGNPAAVCVVDSWPETETMLNIASESNSPATTFLVRGQEGISLRWFTSKVEEEMCGHGTLGAAWVVLNEMGPDLSHVTFSTRAGQLTVRRSMEGYVLDLPTRHHNSVPRNPTINRAIGRPPAELLTSIYHIAIMETGRDVAEITPDLGLVAKLPLPGLIVSGPGNEFGCDVVLRYFAPAKGIPEDHATGSALSQIIPYWSRRLDKETVTVRQLSARGGAMTCRHIGEKISIVANAELYLKGEIFI